MGANKVHYGRCAMGYIHILCVKRKLFSFKKRTQTPSSFLPKTQAASPSLLSPSLGPLRFVVSHSRFAFAFIGDYHEKIEVPDEGGEGGEGEDVEASI